MHVMNKLILALFEDICTGAISYMRYMINVTLLNINWCNIQWVL